MRCHFYKCPYICHFVYRNTTSQVLCHLQKIVQGRHPEARSDLLLSLTRVSILYEHLPNEVEEQKGTFPYLTIQCEGHHTDWMLLRILESHTMNKVSVRTLWPRIRISISSRVMIQLNRDLFTIKTDFLRQLVGHMEKCLQFSGFMIMTASPSRSSPSSIPQ